MFIIKPVFRLGPARVSAIITRNKGKATDPVQLLFLAKIKEYKEKSKGDEFVEPSPAILKELDKELEKLEKSYGGAKGMDMTGFPEFRFQEPTLDPIDEVPQKEEKGEVEEKSAAEDKKPAPSK